MLKCIENHLRYVFNCSTLGYLSDHIHKNKVDFKKYIITIKSDYYFYRLVTKDSDPLLPTGKAGRLASEPYNFSSEKYKKALNPENNWRAPTLGTGVATLSEQFITPFKELGEIVKTSDMDLYKLTLLSPLEVLDFDDLRKNYHISLKNAKKRHEVYHLLYKQHLNGVLFRSSKEDVPPYPLDANEEYNLCIYTDWVKDYRQLFKPEKIEGEKRRGLLRPYFIQETIRVLTPI